MYKQYVIYRNMLNKLKRKSKQHYYKDIFEQYRHDTKKLWQNINTLIGRTENKRTILQTFKFGNTTTSNPQIIADEFCDYFTEVGPNLANQIPQSIHTATHYLNKNQPITSSFYITPTNPIEVQEILKKMKPKPV